MPDRRKGGDRVKLATWNVNSIRARLELVVRWLREETPDIFCMQETKVEPELFPAEPFHDLGYHLLVSGRKSWNGVAIASRAEPTDVREGLPGGFLQDQKRLLSMRIGGLRIVNVYVPNGGDVTLDRFGEKLQYLDELTAFAADLSPDGPLVVMGDFNVAPEIDDVYDPVALDGSICFHPEERARVRKMLATGMEDVFRRFNPTGKAYSWWDYRSMAFRRKMGMRLDLILLNGPAASLAEDCVIQAAPRKWEKPSDHAPVVLTLRDAVRE
jgi:exodeoxyribonuclease III